MQKDQTGTGGKLVPANDVTGTAVNDETGVLARAG